MRAEPAALQLKAEARSGPKLLARMTGELGSQDVENFWNWRLFIRVLPDVFHG